MASPAQVVRALLIDAGLVILPGVTQIPGDGSTPCFVSSVPSEIDQCVFLKDMGGFMFGRRMKDPKELVHPGIIVLVRHLDPGAGYDLTNSIAAVFLAINNSQVTTPEDDQAHYVQSLYRTSSIVDLGEERGRRRQRWTFNARIAFQDQEPSLG